MCRSLTFDRFTCIRNTFPEKLTSTSRSLSFRQSHLPVMWRQFVSPNPPFSNWINTRVIRQLWLGLEPLFAPENSPICYKEQLLQSMTTGMMLWGSTETYWLQKVTKNIKVSQKDKKNIILTIQRDRGANKTSCFSMHNLCDRTEEGSVLQHFFVQCSLLSFLNSILIDLTF